MVGIRRRNVVALVLLVAISGATVLTMVPQRATGTLVSHSLSQDDVTRIQEVLSRERAPLLRGRFAATNGRDLWRGLRERCGGKLRSITSVDSQYVRVEYCDRWSARITYEYELRREADNWAIVGVVYVSETKSPRKGEKASLPKYRP
jgi:hypothetical protein